MRTELFFSLFLGAAAAVAGAQDASLQMTVSGGPYRVGDQVPVRVVAGGGGDGMWGELHVAADQGVRWALVDGPREISGSRPPAWELTLAPLEVGDLPLPSPVVVLRDLDGNPTQISPEAVPVVSVVSVLPTEGEPELEPMRAPIGVAGFPWEWVLPLALLLALPTAAVFSGVFFVSRRLLDRVVPSFRAPPEPLEEFEGLLERLRPRVGREPAEGICDRLAAGLRHYLQRQCHEPAEDMTSFELRLLLRRLEWPDAVQRRVQVVMAMVDRVRFGRVATHQAELQETLETATEAARAIDEILQAQASEEDIAEEAAG